MYRNLSALSAYRTMRNGRREITQENIIIQKGLKHPYFTIAEGTLPVSNDCNLWKPWNFTGALCIVITLIISPEINFFYRAVATWSLTALSLPRARLKTVNRCGWQCMNHCYNTLPLPSTDICTEFWCGQYHFQNKSWEKIL